MQMGETDLDYNGHRFVQKDRVWDVHLPFGLPQIMVYGKHKYCMNILYMFTCLILCGAASCHFIRS